jgi:hypothetical protein
MIFCAEVTYSFSAEVKLQVYLPKPHLLHFLLNHRQCLESTRQIPRSSFDLFWRIC